MPTSPSETALVIVIPSDLVQLLAIGNSVRSSDAEDTEGKGQENVRTTKYVNTRHKSQLLKT